MVKGLFRTRVSFAMIRGRVVKVVEGWRCLLAAVCRCDIHPQNACKPTAEAVMRTAEPRAL